MKTIRTFFSFMALALVSQLVFSVPLKGGCSVVKSASLPGPGGHGSAGAYVGVVDDAVLMAGGSDFLGLKPWEGGVKTWLDEIWVIRDNGGKISCDLLDGVELPQGMGNGCSVSTGKELLCLGGMTSGGFTPVILSVRKSGTSFDVSEVGVLPEGFVPNAAEYYKGHIYVAGSRDGRNVMLRLNPSTWQSRELSPCPDRLLSEGSVLVHQHDGRQDALYLIGGRGVDEEGIHIADRVWEYVPGRDEWLPKAEFNDGGKPMDLMYSSAVRYGSANILVFGGDDGVEFRRREALSAKPDAADELKEAFVSHGGFSCKVFSYHVVTDTWICLETLGFTLPACSKAVSLGGKIIIPSGEVRPGVRSNEILVATVAEPVSFGWVNYAIVVLYLLLMMGVGYYFSRKNSGSEKFFKGDANIPWWAAGISIFATALSAITFLSIPAKAYATDWGMFMFNMTIVMVVPIVINFYLPLFRKLKVASAYEYLEGRFSPAVRLLASAFFCVFMFTRIAVVLFLPSLALNAVTGIDIYLCVLLMGVVTIIYCTMGGIEAVVWGDVIQGFLLVGGALLSLVWIIGGIDGGFGGMMEVAAENHKFNILDFSFDWTRPVFWVTLLGGLSNQLLTYTSDQSVVQKYLTVKDDEGTKRGLWLNGLLSIPIAVIFFGIGTALFVFFKQNPELLSVGMSNTDSIYPHYIMRELPVGVSGLLIAAVFAAAMSTLSSNINSSTTVMSVDFYSRFKKDCTDGQKVRFARISGVLVGALGVAMAIVLATFDIASLWDQFNFFLGLLTSGLGGLFMMGIFSKRIGARSAIAGFVGCVVVLLLVNRFTEVTSVLYGFLGLVSCFVIGWLSSFVFGKGK